MYVSEGVSSRFDTYRLKRKGRTAWDVVSEAVTKYAGELEAVLEAAKVVAGPASELFPVDERKVKYVGGGPVPIQFTPTKEQAAVLDMLGERVGIPTRSTWIAPVLNKFLPGKPDTA